MTISIPDKAEAEEILLGEIRKHLDDLPAGKQVMLKLTLPTKANLYKPLTQDPRVMRVVALSGGYSRDEANAKLSHNAGMIASFSRALTEGLSVHQTDAEFNAALGAAIDSISRRPASSDSWPRPGRAGADGPLAPPGEWNEKPEKAV